MRIVFMGTPQFAVPSLEILAAHGYDIAAVVTAPDKPGGRGMHLQQSAVKQAALNAGLRVLQPEKLKDEVFLQELRDLKADLQVVVAFRMLPQVVWAMPAAGTFNLHASLLPQYRGAAPINRAIMNGEKETGLTTFFLQQEIDTGKIILQEKMPIGDDETAGELHDRMMMAGAGLVLKTVQQVEAGTVHPVEQPAVSSINMAPKIFKEDCLIDWQKPVQQVYNQIRGLSPYPAAFTQVQDKTLKIFSSEKEITDHQEAPGSFLSDGAEWLKVAAADGFLRIKELQIEGKKRMTVQEFLRGHARLFIKQ